MNYLALWPQELDAAGIATLSGERAEYVQYYHDLKPGLVVKALVINGKRGTAEILEANEKFFRAKLSLDQSGPLTSGISFAVALTRPQIVKKVLFYGAMLGVPHIFFFRSNRVVKSYLSSNILREENYNRELIKGLEQSGNCEIPRVSLSSSLQKFLEQDLVEYHTHNPGSSLAIAETTASSRIQDVVQKTPALVVLGPESGFESGETDQFQTSGFKKFQIGPRILRVEVALAVVYGSLIGCPQKS